MKVILYMAISVDGYIAKENDDTSWISLDEWNSYSAMVRESGNLIVGKRTYGILTKQPEFSELKDVKLVVVTHNDFKTLSNSHLIVKTPKEALDSLKEYKQVIVAGDGILNASFLKERLLDEIYVDIEPIILGKGIPLFGAEGFDVKLELLETKKISKNTLQLHYKVKK